MSWSFAGVTFAVVSDGAIEAEWFAARVNRAVDAVLGGQRVYVDIGATIREPLDVVAQVTSKATRTSLEALLGSSGTLSDDDGRSATVRLVSATPIRVVKRDSGIYRLAMTFEFVQ